jgi:hypothetical protein
MGAKGGHVLREAIAGGGDRDGGAGEGGAIAAGGAAIDEAVDVGEGSAGGVEEIFEVHGFELVDIGEHLQEEGIVFFEKTTLTAVFAVSGAKLLAAFGDAAAFMARFVDVNAFLDHDGFLQQHKSPAGWARLLFFYPKFRISG